MDLCPVSLSSSESMKSSDGGLLVKRKQRLISPHPSLAHYKSEPLAGKSGSDVPTPRTLRHDEPGTGGEKRIQIKTFCRDFNVQSLKKNNKKKKT